MHIGDLLSAYTGRTLSIDGSLDGVVRLAEFMINRELARAVAEDGELIPFQLGRATDTVRPTLAECFPWLDDIVPPHFDDLDKKQARIARMAWMEKIIKEYGAVHHIPQLQEGIWVDMDPTAELRDMMQPGGTVVAAWNANGVWETMTDPVPGTFHNPRLDETPADDD